MKIVNTVCEKLNPKTRKRLEDRVLHGPSRPNARVFLAKSGTRTLGAAVVEHESNKYNGQRDLYVYMDAQSAKAEEALRNKVMDATRYLKRKINFV